MFGLHNPYTVTHKSKHGRRDSLELPLYTITSFDDDMDETTIAAAATITTATTAVGAPTVVLTNLDIFSPALPSLRSPTFESNRLLPTHSDSLSLPRTVFELSPHSPRTTALFLTGTPTMPLPPPRLSLKERFLSVLQSTVKWGSIVGFGYAGYWIIKQEIIKQSEGGARSTSFPLMGIVIVVCAAVVFAVLANIGRVVVGGWREYRRVTGSRRRRDQEEEIVGHGGIRLEGVEGWWGRGNREEEESEASGRVSRGRRESSWEGVGELMERIDEEEETGDFEQLEEMEEVVDEKMGLLEGMEDMAV